MTELKTSEFRMFPSAPYALPHPGTITELTVLGIKEIEKTYGPVYTVKFIKYALEFEAQKIKEEPPKDIETLDQLTKYLISKSDKYPKPYCAIIYAGVRAERDLQGQVGVGFRVGTMGALRSEAKTITEKKSVDVDSIMEKFYQWQTSLAISPVMWGYRKNEDESVDCLWPKCHYMDGCQKAYDEGLFKQLNKVKVKCANAMTVSFYLKLLSGYEWDYDVKVFNEKNCLVKCYLI